MNLSFFMSISSTSSDNKNTTPPVDLQVKNLDDPKIRDVAEPIINPKKRSMPFGEQKEIPPKKRKISSQNPPQNEKEEIISILDLWVSLGNENEQRAQAKQEIIDLLFPTDFFSKILGISKSLLNLSGLNLKAVPDIFGKQTVIDKVFSIDFSKNKLSELPKSFGNLKNLKTLDISSNQLEEVPKEIERLDQIQELILYKNQLIELSENIGNLTQLKKINLANNKLESLPNEITRLILLEDLYLSNNQLQMIPEKIGSLANLKNIYLSYNELEILPKSIEELHQLIKFHLAYNLLSKLPKNIGNLRRLEEFNLRGNPELSALPVSIFNLKTSCVVNVENTKLSKETLDDLRKTVSKECPSPNFLT